MQIVTNNLFFSNQLDIEWQLVDLYSFACILLVFFLQVTLKQKFSYAIAKPIHISCLFWGAIIISL